LEEARLSDNVALIVKSLNFMGVAMIAQGDLNSAALTLEQALILSEAETVPPELDSLWGNLGLLAFKAGRFADAAELWRRAAEEAEARNLSPSLYHSNLARLYLSQGRDGEFKQEVAFALASSLEPSTTRSARAEALNLAAMAALSEDKPTEAQLHIDAALQLDREDENQTGLAQDLEILAELMIKTGSLKQAASNLDRAFYLWAALGDKEAQRRVFEQMRNLEKQTTLAKSLSSYQEVLNTPALFDPINRLCP
jgi:tetratricopeptide (TPR) repeat protein